ncbi:MAG TPA: diadenylate cyclase CdaA [bacterium]|nr:diadenylate cyclase CdaA [bacterium]
MHSIGGKILGVTDKTYYFWDSFRSASFPIILLDLLIVTTIFYWIYIFLRETRAMRILYGLFFLLVLMALGRIFNLILLNWLLQYVMAMLLVAIAVVFQPELRAALERLGRTKFIGEPLYSRSTPTSVVDEIVLACLSLAKSKIGALIVIQRQTGLREYIEKGVDLNADVSRSILTTIFFPKSPLHDGAVIINGDKIIAARTTLPVSDSLVNTTLGTRHKAAIGITENSDAVAIVVSEETGQISLAVGGKLERKIAEDRLRNRLSALIRSSKRQ